MIQLTTAARQEIDRLRRRQKQPDAICRLNLQPSSCAEWAYALSLEPALGGAEDQIYEFDGIQLVVERSLLARIQGLKIDFAEDLTGGAFRFNNPLATESCRCGAAFATR
ncbi:iron-sulfur cluster assembly accessory protein [cf. Phormidesmis sp. LEGE 11477]|uniref:HesB/IscA family protein n=1 Tax=cf. Phormidesmis sp. LEGE 11477 TaxID=1828680 RepID=UPI00187E7359|nr:iron-sulfur cluster assembly accessory protein [cf. Phormidesmis sp. LEGE 11477]MBE9060039.1 iron-sulfur cluster assembly accessory protein [cf. Phormidesmis sp. LEGE 11477]